MPQLTPSGRDTTEPTGAVRSAPASVVPQALLDRREGRSRPRPAEPCDGPLVQELTSAIPPVDDIGRSISSEGGGPRFTFGDGGERRMTEHLWNAILLDGLDQATRQEVQASSIAPPSMAGPLPTRAGLRLMKTGVFYALTVEGAERQVRWLAGTLFRGGHADRLLTEDTIVEGGAPEMTVACFACEGHRQPGDDRQLYPVEAIIAPPTLRQLARDGDQFAFWDRVARICHRFAPTSRSLVQALSSSTIESLVREDLAALVANLEAPGTLGAVLLLHGVPVAADLFQNESDFIAAREGLVRGYVIEAMIRADCHRAEGIEVLSATSTGGKRALAKLLASQEEGAHPDTWHTFLCA